MIWIVILSQDRLKEYVSKLWHRLDELHRKKKTNHHNINKIIHHHNKPNSISQTINPNSVQLQSNLMHPPFYYLRDRVRENLWYAQDCVFVENAVGLWHWNLLQPTTRTAAVCSNGNNTRMHGNTKLYQRRCRTIKTKCIKLPLPQWRYWSIFHHETMERTNLTTIMERDNSCLCSLATLRKYGVKHLKVLPGRAMRNRVSLALRSLLNDNDATVTNDLRRRHSQALNDVGHSRSILFQNSGSLRSCWDGLPSSIG